MRANFCRRRSGLTGSSSHARRSASFGEFLEQRTVEAARGAIVDILDGGLVA